MISSADVEEIQKVYKISPAAVWLKACETGVFEGSLDDARDGYIHLSSASQVRSTLNKYYRGQSGLLLIAFEKNSLAPNLHWEVSRNGDLFPHYYGALPTNLAIAQMPLVIDANGLAQLDEDCL